MRAVSAALVLGLVWQASNVQIALADTPPTIVVELFTSQGCSSCPPADALLVELARDRPDVLALAFHVTYWNTLGWQDPFSFAGATDRQRRYAVTLGLDTIYTPQMVVDGRTDVVGSDRPAVWRALQQAASLRPTATSVSLARNGDAIDIAVGAGVGVGTVWLIGYDAIRRTAVAHGENGGRTLTEANIVRSFVPVARWTGDTLNLREPVPAGQLVAMMVQMDDGKILGAARLESHN